MKEANGLVVNCNRVIQEYSKVELGDANLKKQLAEQSKAY